ncbi:putative WRKY transcription factor [Arachis hypogaea]|nr:putative WRKY transcription factor [Arachis hypogaea]
MGREIIRENLPLPEERSRLWNPEEVLDVLSKDMGTKAIQGLALKLSRMKPIHLKTNAFRKMKRLRLLQLGGVQLDGDFKYLSTDLPWLSWHGCSSEYTTTDANEVGNSQSESFSIFDRDS